MRLWSVLAGWNGSSSLDRFLKGQIILGGRSYHFAAASLGALVVASIVSSSSDLSC